jgi:hypothetical protein
MTLTMKEILNDACVGYNDYFSAFNDHKDDSVAFREIIYKAMTLFAQQTRDAQIQNCADTQAVPFGEQSWIYYGILNAPKQELK